LCDWYTSLLRQKPPAPGFLVLVCLVIAIPAGRSTTMLSVIVLCEILCPLEMTLIVYMYF
jgi:hypothetical protein